MRDILDGIEIDKGGWPTLAFLLLLACIIALLV